MNVNGNGSADGIFIGIDLGDVRRSMQAREKMKAKAAESQSDGREMRQDPNFQANRLINTLQEKGRMLDMVV
jgi:hypothetical protein